MPAAQREYSDRLFSYIFGSEENKAWTLSLYNAVNGTNYTDPEAIRFNTIRQVLYLGMHNDTSFLVASEMNMYEQQSTYNPNMPVRMLQYAGNLYEKYFQENHLNKFGKKLLPLPVPKLVVFYNGEDHQEEELVLHLSSSFPPGADPDIMVRVRMLNINYGQSEEILSACRPLREYAWLIREIRNNRKSMDIEEAVNRALNGMPEEYEIKPFLEAHRAEVFGMLLTEYNEAEAMQLFREDGIEEGLEKGLEKGHKEGREEEHQCILENVTRNLMAKDPALTVEEARKQARALMA